MRRHRQRRVLRKVRGCNRDACSLVVALVVEVVVEVVVRLDLGWSSVARLVELALALAVVPWLYDRLASLPELVSQGIFQLRIGLLVQLLKLHEQLQ
jgi:hypothetical protein